MLHASDKRSDEWLLEVPKIVAQPNFDDYQAYQEVAFLARGIGVCR